MMPTVPASASTLFDLTGRVAIITGASSGLGARFASVLHHAGARVVLAARRRERLEALAESLPGSLVVPCDVTLDRDRRDLVERATVVGPVEILVNNAGMMTPGPTGTEPVSAFDATIALNLTATFGLAQLVSVGMIARRRGTVINLSSVLGVVASDGLPYPAYAASKAAVIHLTRELGAQWGRHGVRCNAIAPGWFRSEITEDILDDERSLRAIIRKTPMGRIGSEDDLDGALLFLASDASRFMTGETLIIDGGLTLT